MVARPEHSGTGTERSDPDPGPAPGSEPVGAAALELFAALTGVMFCVKDRAGRYVEVNDAFVRRARARSRAAVIGRTARELFVPVLAERYEQQDARVLATGRVLRHELELIRGRGGAPGWYLSTKVPLVDDGRVVGVAGVSEDLREADADDAALQALAAVVEVVHARLADPPRPAELAAVAGCSTDALERRTRRVFGLSPGQFVLRARIDHARALLGGTDVPLSEVASACGFYDQPALSRQFARLSGETPGQYRRRAQR